MYMKLCHFSFIFLYRFCNNSLELLTTSLSVTRLSSRLSFDEILKLKQFNQFTTVHQKNEVCKFKHYMLLEQTTGSSFFNVTVTR